MKLLSTQEITVGFFALLNSDQTIQMHYENEIINQQCVKNTRFSIKQQLQKKNNNVINNSQRRVNTTQHILNNKEIIKSPFGKIKCDFSLLYELKVKP